jgi:hypothetical protein
MDFFSIVQNHFATITAPELLGECLAAVVVGLFSFVNGTFLGANMFGGAGSGIPGLFGVAVLVLLLSVGYPIVAAAIVIGELAGIPIGWRNREKF